MFRVRFRRLRLPGRILLLLCPLAALAQVMQPVRLESVPAGAQVFLLRGDQRIPLGATPLDYRASFRSEVSVLRFGFEYPGYEGKELEATPASGKLLARLSAAPGAAPKGDSALRPLQQRLAPQIDGSVRDALAAHSAAEVRSEGPAYLKNVDGRPFVVVPLSLAPTWQVTVSGRGENGEIAGRFWREVGTPIAQAVHQAIPASAGIAGVAVEAAVANGGSGSHIEHSTEMACVSGYRSVFDSCIRQETVYTTTYVDGYQRSSSHARCVSGTRQVYHPCLTRAPRTKFSVKSDRSAAAREGHTRIVGAVAFAALDKNAAAAPALLHTDPSGMPVHQSGQMPRELRNMTPRPAP